MSKIYLYLVNVGDNDHLKIYARNLAEVEEIVDSGGQFDRSMINSVARKEISPPHETIIKSYTECV